MSDAKLRWACIGVGKCTPTRGGASAIAYAHAEGLKRNAARFELVAASARTQQNLDDFAREYPCHTYTDFRELLAKESLDGVALSTYAPDRLAHVKAILEAGVKNVLIEKPLALTMADALAMKSEADRVGARLFVNFQRRYGMPFERVRDLVRLGRLGKIRSVELMQPCANALDFGPHFINMTLDFLGDAAEPQQILAAADGLGEMPWHGMMVERRFTATLTMKDGVKVFFSADPDGNWTAPAVRIVGERGYAELWAEKEAAMGSILRVVTAAGIENPEMDEHFHHGEADKYLYFERAYRDLATVITENRPCRLDFEHGLRTQRILLGAYASAQSGRTFAFGDIEPAPVFRFG